jgi:N-acetylglucosaminyldiphosphoundecaprenol N-acetyl-beta-D-mannosaminyltransferase
MLSLGKRNVLGIMVDAIDYEAAIAFVFERAREGRRAIISAVAVHGIMTGVLDAEHRYRLNCFDLLLPDGQPVRWALNWLHGAKLRDRVYGPELTRRICERAASERTPIFLYGSTSEILNSLVASLEAKFPGISIVGSAPSAFRKLSADERAALEQRIWSTGAAIVLVGLGCPRQEIFAYELQNALSVPVLAVGAAFPLLAGILPQAPTWMQQRGLEWMFRLMVEPRRLWQRYLYLNPAYLFLLTLQGLGLRQFSTDSHPPAEEVMLG